tara:strand:- start:41 stop:787 length:747 start_codon:yes stop_codon:yes gene_type:complete
MKGRSNLKELRKRKILVFDVETSPMEVYTFRIGNKVSIPHTNIKKDSQVICICYKYLGHKKIHSLDWGKDQDDSRLLTRFNEVASEANSILGHNGENFDVRVIKARMMLQGLKTPWGESLTLDTLRSLRSNFRLSSYRLDAVARSLGLGQKNPMDMYDWIKVSNGCRKSLQKMIKYCKQDVQLLEDVFLRVEPYIRFSVADTNKLGVTQSRPKSCPRCGSKQAVKYGTRRSPSGVMQRYQCKSCYHYF